MLSAQAELCCWTGPKLVQDTLLDKMPDSMRKDVEKLLGDIPVTRKRPERFTRKEQAKQVVSGVPAGPATSVAGPSAAAAAAPPEDEVTATACSSKAYISPLLVHAASHSTFPQQQLPAVTKP